MRTKNADAPIDQVLNVGAFDLQRALTVDGSFLEPEYPFEWGGVYQLTPGDYLLKTAGEHDHSAQSKNAQNKNGLSQRHEVHKVPQRFSLCPLRVSSCLREKPF